MSSLDKDFCEYFEGLDRAEGQDRCYLCRRTAAEVKAFFGFHEDGTPLDAGATASSAVLALDDRCATEQMSARHVQESKLSYEMIFMQQQQRAR